MIFLTILNSVFIVLLFWAVWHISSAVKQLQIFKFKELNNNSEEK